MYKKLFFLYSGHTQLYSEIPCDYLGWKVIPDGLIFNVGNQTLVSKQGSDLWNAVYLAKEHFLRPHSTDFKFKAGS